MKKLKKALLLIDVQNDYFEDRRSELCEPLKVLRNIEKVLKIFRTGHFPVIHVQHVNTREGATFFLQGTHGVEIHERLKPLPDEYHVIKHMPNSFYNTNLLEILKKEDITELVICGMMTHMCIDTTTRACKDYGISVTLLDDACATKDLNYSGELIPAKTVHRTFIASLNGMFARVLKTEEYEF